MRREAGESGNVHASVAGYRSQRNVQIVEVLTWKTYQAKGDRGGEVAEKTVSRIWN